MSRFVPHLFSSPSLISLGLTIGIAMSAAVGELHAQDRAASKTTLEVELIYPGLATDPQQAHQWRMAFENVGEGVRIRAGLSREQPSLKELQRGPFRIVRLVGKIERGGTVTFPGHTFKLRETDKIKEWFDELKVYGAQGAPQGQPKWGLTDAQYENVLKQLSSPVAKNVRGEQAAEIISRIPTGELPVVYHSSAESIREQAADLVIAEELEGLTGGTALAFVLSQQGLGFQPLRTPSGSVELVVQPLDSITIPWPIGTPSEKTPRNETFPALFEMVETGVERARLVDVLNAVENRTGVRILLDVRAAIEKGLNPVEITVTYPQKRTAWALIVNTVVGASRLSMNYREDEAGTGFLYIAPFTPYRREDR